MIVAERFAGLPKDFFAFFGELKLHNERIWFEANKTRFRDSVQMPMSAFIAAMAPQLRRISKQFAADPRPNGGSMLRIYRDVRFSHDKRPYKEHAACHFRHALGKDVHAPGFYMHFAPGEVFFGGGLSHPESGALGKVRAAIAEKSAAWRKALGGRAFRQIRTRTGRGADAPTARLRSGTSAHRRSQAQELLCDATGQPGAGAIARAGGEGCGCLPGNRPPDAFSL